MVAWLGSLFSLVLTAYIADAAPKKNYVGVIGGEVARIEDFSFQVSLKIMDQHVCGGVIIHEQFILTAAHCSFESDDGAGRYTVKLHNGTTYPSHFKTYCKCHKVHFDHDWFSKSEDGDERDISTYSVLVGTSNVNKGGESYKVENIVIHENFDRINGDYDLAVFKLTDKLVFSDKVAIAKLPTQEQNFNHGTIFNITGWGLTETTGWTSEVLLRAEVRWVDLDTCKKQYANSTEVNDRMFCAGREGHDACEGDSGGPSSRYGEVFGLVSRGRCAHKDYPTIYMKISKFHEWIENAINSNL